MAMFNQRTAGKIIIFLGLLVLIWLVFGKDRPSPPRTVLSVGDWTIQAEIADTAVKREQGLSGQAKLGDNEGMLFIFDQPGVYAFWMKEMRFPLDIIWFDAAGRVRGLAANLAPESFPKLFTPPGPIKYALEINAGAVAEHQIKMGDQLNFLK